MTNLLRHAAILVICSAVGGAGCDDPTAGKANAEVGSAKTVDSGAKASGPTYEIVATDSKLGFVGSKVTGSHEGGFKKLSGSATLNAGKVEGGSVQVEIDMDSTYSDNEKLTGHLKNEDFFHVAKFGTSKFQSTKIAQGGEGGTHTIEGNLTLHGVTKSIEFPATIEVKGDTATVKSEFVIKRQQFGIEYKGKADDLIKDEVLIKLDLKLKKK